MALPAVPLKRASLSRAVTRQAFSAFSQDPVSVL
jgi:hypothetical protein